MRTMPNAFHGIYDCFKTQKMCIKAVKVDPSFLQLVSDHFKTQETCDKAVKDDSSSLQFVPDWFVTREGLYMWYDDYYNDDHGHCYENDNEDTFFEWYDGYKKRKAQNVKIKKEFMHIACHSSRCVIGACQKKRNKRQKNCGHRHEPFCVWRPDTTMF